MKHYFIACFFLITTSACALDQLPDDIFNIFMHYAISLKDTQGIFSVVAANKKILAQSKVWCIKERDPHIIERLLHKACDNASWTVHFALCNPHITSTMVGNAINHTTSNESQKILSKKFPHALHDGPQKKLQIKHREGIARFIRNGFIIKTVYDGYHRSMPPLIYFSNCIESPSKNCFYPHDVYDYQKTLTKFELDLKVITILLDQKANPGFEINLRLSFDSQSVRSFDAYTTIRHHKSYKALSKKNRTALKNLLNTYKRTPENSQIPYFE